MGSNPIGLHQYYQGSAAMRALYLWISIPDRAVKINEEEAGANSGCQYDVPSEYADKKIHQSIVAFFIIGGHEKADFRLNENRPFIIFYGLSAANKDHSPT